MTWLQWIMAALVPFNMASDDSWFHDVTLVTGACRGLALADIALVAINLDLRGYFITSLLSMQVGASNYLTYKNKEHVTNTTLASSFLDLFTKTPDGKTRKCLWT